MAWKETYGSMWSALRAVVKTPPSGWLTANLEYPANCPRHMCICVCPLICLMATGMRCRRPLSTMLPSWSRRTALRVSVPVSCYTCRLSHLLTIFLNLPLGNKKNSLTVRGHLLLLQPHVPRLKIQCADYLYALVKSQGLYRSK
jgi:hypothetical protein